MKNLLKLVVWNVRSRHNVGSFFRTADGAGFSHIHLCGITPTPPHSRIAKVSLGAEQAIPFSHHARLLPLIKKLKKEGYTIIALELTKKSIPLYAYTVPKNQSRFLWGVKRRECPKQRLPFVTPTYTFPCVA